MISTMETLLYTALYTLLASVARSMPTANSQATLDLRMPHVQPQQEDTYLCYPTKVQDGTLYITGFEPHAEMNVSHHMLLYGCAEPGATDGTWNCGEMAAEHESEPSGPVCASGAEIIYAWAMDAPDLTLPPDVAFKVGDGTNIGWLVLQVHYKDVSSFQGPDAETDNSGITLHTTTTPQPKTAGVYLLGTGGAIPPHSTVYMETACTVESPVTMHPFAYRAHTHMHGEVVSGYRVHDGEWQEIGRVSPKLPEMFYDVTDPDISVQDGDILAARCTMLNNEDREIDVGATQHDEMCNFYVMYWVEGPTLPENGYCFTDGPPTWSWADFAPLSGLETPLNASLVPGSEEVLMAGEHLFQDAEATLREIEEALERKLLELLTGYDNYYDNGLYDYNNAPSDPLYDLLLNRDSQDYYQALPDYRGMPFDNGYYGDDTGYQGGFQGLEDVQGYDMPAPGSYNMFDSRNSANKESLRRQFLDYYQDME